MINMQEAIEKLNELFDTKEDDGLTKVQVEKVKKILKDAGIKCDMDDSYKHSDTNFYYDYVNIFVLAKGDFKVEVVPVGDIEIYDKNKPDVYFIYKGGKPDTGVNSGLTEDLLKNGEYKANNWFEINVYKRNKYGKYSYYDVGDENIAESPHLDKEAHVL